MPRPRVAREKVTRDEPLTKEQRARANFMGIGVRRTILQGLDMTYEELVAYNKLHAEDMAGHGWVFINLFEGSKVDPIAVCDRYADEMICFVDENDQLTKPEGWMVQRGKSK